MTCSRSLSQLVTWFEQGFPCRNHWLAETAAGRNARTAFLSKYPFRNRPELVEEGIQSPDQVLDFLHRLEVDLRPLGGLNLRNDRAFREGAANIERFKAALAVAVDGKKSLASRIDDDAWSKIPGFGRSKTMDRVVARKIVSTYFPNDTMPIFNTSHLEHFADWLGIKLKELSPSRNQSYASSSGGQKWQLLCQSLIEAKSHLPAIASKDNAYFMGCLYAGYARPGPPFPPNPCAKHPTVRIPPRPSNPQASPTSQYPMGREVADEVYELETGIKKSQQFFASPEARRAVELRAVRVATAHLEENRWSVDDISNEKRGYDLHCKRADEVLMVEVKGKASDGNKVLLTANEVLHAQSKHPRAALIVVFGIKVTQDSHGQINAIGGEVRELNPWNPNQGKLTPIAYRYELP